MLECLRGHKDYNGKVYYATACPVCDEEKKNGARSGYCAAALIGQDNVGFTIIAVKPAVTDFPAEIVLAVNVKDKSTVGGTVEYVTWLFNGESNGFFFGHYTMDFKEAVNDFFKRS